MANLSPTDISGISNSLNSLRTDSSIVTNTVNSITTSFQDPLGSSIFKALTSINGLTNTVNSKIDSLSSDIVKSVDSHGRVQLIDNKIVITIEPEDIKKASQISSTIQGKIGTINSMISRLNILLNTLSILTTTARTIKTALDIQEALLSINPISKATLTVFKKAIKILFFKDIMTQYINVLSSQLSFNKIIINELSRKFRNLQVQININDHSNKGDLIDQNKARENIANQLLANGTDNTGSSSNNFVSSSGKQYILKVEKYGKTEIIARAYDKFSGNLVTETAPSFVSTSDQLLNELKQILV